MGRANPLGPCLQRALPCCTAFAMLTKTLSACALVMGALLGWTPAAMAVTINDDTHAHLWHSFNTPDKSFEGAAGYAGPAWLNTDAGALYMEWGGGFTPMAYTGSNRWTFVAPTIGHEGNGGLSTGLSVVLKETSGSGLLTGAGNIYGIAGGQVPGPPLVFNLVLTDSFAGSHDPNLVRTVVMRTGTKGTLPDMNARLNGALAQSWTNTFRIDGTIDMPTGPGGAMQPELTSDAEWLWVWEDVPVAGTYEVNFQALVGHMSLDNLVIYASPPHPAATQRGAVILSHALAGQLADAAATETLLASSVRHLQRFLAHVQDLARGLVESQA